MDIPVSAFGATVEEGRMYFFKSDCPIGVKDHIHICIKRGDKIFLFVAGSSKVEKAIKRAQILGYDINTYPIFKATDLNKLDKPMTYVDCNRPIEISHEVFCDLLKENKIYELNGEFDSESLDIIIKGVNLSNLVETRIKDLLS